MAEYYYDRADRAPKRRSPLMLIVDIVVLLLSVLFFVAMTLALVTSYYDPSISWIFPVLGLFTPAVYVGTTLCALYWIIRARWFYAVILLLPLLVGLPSISRYLNIEVSKSYGEPSRRGTVRVLSYNVKGFIGDDQQSSQHGMQEFLNEQRPDVICFQEFAKSRMSESDEPDAIKNFNRAKIKELAIYSRYKILGSSDDLVNSDYDSGSAFWADLLIGGDTVRVYNVHLHSTAITTLDDSYITNMEFINDTLSDDMFRGMLSRFRTTSIGRAAQADTIAHSIAQTPHRVVVCGDFNDTPNSYAYRKISEGLQDSFQEAGVGYSYTFRGFKNLLRIDYILAQEPTQVLSYQVIDSVLLSDHLPVVTTLKF
ncbi:MAG: endonuclease/exonuclease/phosphatase family protein [Rikenellaceae bacterium]